MQTAEPNVSRSKLNRRRFLQTLSAAPFGLAASSLFQGCNSNAPQTSVFIAKARTYSDDLTSLILAGFRELGISAEEIRGKRVLLKVNIIEPRRHAEHIVTHPAVAFAAAEAFLKMGAARIIVAEGAGHCRDTYQILELSGFDHIFDDKRLAFIDLNYDDWFTVSNIGRETNLKSFVFPAVFKQADWIVSIPKLKTHHLAGVTLSMKNMFGALPGTFYGWPKNVFHQKGIIESILDINTTLRPHLAIVDGIVGMEGDGPIMGNPKSAGVLVMGRNLAAVDSTCARLMGINPRKVAYLSKAANRLGPIKEPQIVQRGESWQSVRTDFQLLDYIDAHRGLRL